MDTTKVLKIARYAIIGTVMVIFVALAVATGVQRKTIKRQQAAMEWQAAAMDSLNHTVNALWGQECIRVENTIQITQKGLVTVNQANNISRSVSEITRGELLMAMDSLERARKQ